MASLKKQKSDAGIPPKKTPQPVSRKKPPKGKLLPLPVLEVLSMGHGYLPFNQQATFLAEHPTWESRLSSDTLWPAIPMELFQNLIMDDGKYLLPVDEIRAEIKFSGSMSSLFNAVGIRNGRLVTFPPYTDLNSCPELIRHTSREFQDDFIKGAIATSGGRIKSGKSDAVEIAVTMDGYRRSVTVRMLGYAGWLNTNPIYRKELEHVRTVFKSLPVFPKFPFIQDEVVRNESSAQHDDEKTFYRHLRRLLQRWGIAAFYDWELPLPVGPCSGTRELVSFQDPLSETGVWIDLPAWYGVVNQKDELIKTIDYCQKKRGGDRLISGDEWPIRNPARYAGMFLCQLAFSALEKRTKLVRGTPEYATAVKAIGIWLQSRLPEKRGGANHIDQDTPGYSDDAEMRKVIEEEEAEKRQNKNLSARVESLMRMARSRLKGVQPKALAK